MPVENETNASYWICRNISISETGISTFIPGMGFCQPSQQNINKTIVNVTKNTTCQNDSNEDCYTSTAILIILVCIIALFMLIVLAFLVRKKVSKLHKYTNTNYFHCNSSPQSPAKDKGVYLESDAACHVERGSRRERTRKVFANLSRRKVSEDASETNPIVPKSEKVNFIPYIPNREMDRKDFTIGEVLGSGNFGTVYKGIALDLFYPGSKTT